MQESDAKPPVIPSAPPAAPTAPAPQGMSADVMAIVTQIKADADKAQADLRAQIDGLSKEKDAAAAKLAGYTKAESDAVEARVAKLGDKDRAIVEMVRAKLSPTELAQYIDKLTSGGPSTPPPGAPRGDAAGDDSSLPPTKGYQPKHGKIVEQQTGKKLVHIQSTVFSALPGSRFFGVPLAKFREMLKTTSGKDATGKPTKY